MINEINVSLWIAELGIWPLLVVLVLNLLFRRYGAQEVKKKRFASLYQAIAVFLVSTIAMLVREWGWDESVFFGGFFAILLALILLRKKIFPYCLRCVSCERKLTLQSIYFMDDNLCHDCHLLVKKKEVAERERSKEES